jgi:tetrathionate reductase subunit B
VSCKAENDVPLGHFIRQTIYKDVGMYPRVARVFLPVTCQHCGDAPCIKACPCGALYKGVGGSVLVDYDRCCGYGKCRQVCPYGAIYLDPVTKQAVKCHNCYHRLLAGMEPACVATCPVQALHFGDLNDPGSSLSVAMREARNDQVELVQLRPEEGTQPQAWYAGPGTKAVDRVPTQGRSYGPNAYNVYEWKEGQER